MILYSFIKYLSNSFFPKKKDPHQYIKFSKLSIVDLAGSERTNRTQNKGERLKEASKINTSLLVFGRCIEVLRHNQLYPQRPMVVPFNDSTMTRLFRDYFTSEGKAVMVVNINPSPEDFDENLHVLHFSALAKDVSISTTIDTGRGKRTQSRLPEKEICSVVDRSFLEAPVAGCTLDTEKLLLDLAEAREQLVRSEALIRNEMADEFASQMIEMEESFNARLVSEIAFLESKSAERMKIQEEFYSGQIEDLLSQVAKLKKDLEMTKNSKVSPAKIHIFDRPRERESDSAYIYETDITESRTGEGVTGVIKDIQKIPKPVADNYMDKQTSPRHIGDVVPELKKKMGGKRKKEDKKKKKKEKRRKTEEEEEEEERTKDVENTPPGSPAAKDSSFVDVPLKDSFDKKKGSKGDKLAVQLGKKALKEKNIDSFSNVPKHNLLSHPEKISFGDLTGAEASPKKKGVQEKLPQNSKLKETKNVRKKVEEEEEDPLRPAKKSSRVKKKTNYFHF